MIFDAVAGVGELARPVIGFVFISHAGLAVGALTGYTARHYMNKSLLEQFRGLCGMGRAGGTILAITR